MFLFGLLVTLYVIVCFLLILLVLVQKGKGNLGIGNLGGSTQMLFGGSGGQDLFQKITWVLGAFFMFSSLFLSIMKTAQYNESRYLNKSRSMVKTIPAQQQTPVAQEANPLTEPAALPTTNEEPTAAQ